ncbi:MAG: anthranilate phosphoribosyltransferase [Bacilli bacterium]|nr:anthranilate phosphoribosyltransferase [Bacilli bacterium]
MQSILAQVIEGKSLTSDQAEHAMGQIMMGEATHSQIGSFLTALRIKGETVEEITGFAKSMRRFAKVVEFPADELVDTCGTGGSGITRFNVSTTAAIVAAAGGVPIAKHGNRKVTSISGSADVLEALGVRVDLEPEGVANCLRQARIGFMLAPQYHQAMKHAMAPRKELGFRTVLNYMGPLLNPAGAKRQIIGVSSRDMVEKIAHVLVNLGAIHALVVHGEEGLDELSVSGPSFVAEVKNGTVTTYTVIPEELGLTRHPLEAILCDSPLHSAAIIRGVLQGVPGAPRDIVVVNAAASLLVGGLVGSLAEGVHKSNQLIDSGLAAETLERFIEVSQAAAVGAEV